MATRPDAEQLGALEGTADLLRSLGHEVVERDFPWGPVFGNFLARYLRGVHDEAAQMPYPERLSRRTRGYMRIGGLIPDAVLARARSEEAKDRERANRHLRRRASTSS